MWNFLKRRERTNWIDVGMYDRDGHYKLVQMRMVVENNKKEFRTVSLGFINDYINKPNLFKNILGNNIEKV